MFHADRYGVKFSPDVLIGFLLVWFIIGTVYAVIKTVQKQRQSGQTGKLQFDWITTVITLLLIIGFRVVLGLLGVKELSVRFYGVIIISGAILAAFLASTRAKRMGQNPEQIWDMLIWLIIGGIIGARIWHVLTPPPSMTDQGITTMYYFTHPLEILKVWNGGLGIVGGVIGGFLALVIYSRNMKNSLFAWIDIIAPCLLLAQAIGRWGNFVNQELYGAPTSLPWKLYIEPANRLEGFTNVEYYHPLFLYESLWNLLSIGILIWIEKRFSKALKTGDSFLLYLILYPLTRFTLEFLRLNASLVAGVNANQWVMVIVMVFSVIALFWRHWKDGKISQ